MHSNTLHAKKSIGSILLLSLLFFVFICTSAKAVQINNIPHYGQRTGFLIPADVNPNNVWIDTTDYGAYVDCGMVCLCMIESYFSGYGSEDAYVYYKTYATRNPDVAWSSIDRDVYVDSQPYPIAGYADFISMTPEEVLAQLNAGNPVMVHRWYPSDHWVIIYGYDGPTDYINWGNFKIMSPTYDYGVITQNLSQFVSNYTDHLNHFMYRTSGYLANKKVPANIGDSFLAKIHLVEGGAAIAATSSGNIELAADADTAFQDWRFDRMGNGTYIITNLRNGQVMDLAHGGLMNGTNIGLCPRHDNGDLSQKYQRWYIYENPDGSGYYRLSPEPASMRSMDATSGSTTPGTNIQLWDSNDTPAQRIRIDRFGGYALEKITCSESSLELDQGGRRQLSVSYTPWQEIQLKMRGVKWTSSNEAVATVSSDGLVTARGEGSCVITATSTYNDLLSSSCSVTVKSGLQTPEITELEVSDFNIHVAWGASPAMDENDVRGYEVFVYPKGDIDNYVWSNWNVADTSCDIALTEPGEYVVYVRAINKTTNSRSDFDSREFTLVGDDWLYLDELPDDLSDIEIQYLNHYNDREQLESPGEGWIRGESKTTYVNGNVLYSEDPYPLQETDTRVYLGTFYYHYCDGSSAVEAFWTNQFCNRTVLDNNGQFDVVWSAPDETNSYYTVYRLQWNSGEWAGGLATCPHGSASPMSLYYLGHRYQERTAITTYMWSKETAWSTEMDPNADSVSYRVRNVSYENQLTLPEGTTRIEAEAFMNNALIQEVIVPTGCEYIGSKAFADCSDLRRVYIPESAVVASDAFEGCSQVQIIRTGSALS